MLADARATALVENFADQWLYLRNLQAAAPDARLFPDVDQNLKDAMRRETELLFLDVVREDRSVLDLLRTSSTWLNERLARHYGIPNVYGEAFRRVTFDNGERGGLLGQGSILTVTSYPDRTSPVVRGKWILENLLGTPPPPPPPNVPALKDRNAAGKVLNMRARMEQHRANPACAGCHSPNGAGIPAQYPRIGSQHAEYTEAQLVAFRGGSRNNSAQMSAIAARLSDAEIKAVADYAAGLK